MFGLSLTKNLREIEERNTRQEANLQVLIRELKDRDQFIREMADEIREMDQMIYRMSQCTSWETMRPIFNLLQSKQQVRQVEESKRIGNIVRRENERVYSKPR